MKKIKRKLFDAVFNNQAIKSIGEKEINFLKKKSLVAPKRRFRICLHSNTSHLTQEMIIAINGFSYIKPHKHPKNVSESYHVIKGALNVYILDDKGKVLDLVKLRAQNYKNKKINGYMYRLSKSLFHLTIPMNRWTVYHEVLTGPFKKKKTVKYANFAPDENSNPKIINRFLKKYGIKKRLTFQQH